MLKWYLEHGLIINKVYNIINAEKERPFEEFTNIVSDARRIGDIEEKKIVNGKEIKIKLYEFFGDTMKLVGNSAYGTTGMDKSKHIKVKFVGDNEGKKLRNTYQFKQDEEYNGFIESI